MELIFAEQQYMTRLCVSMWSVNVHRHLCHLTDLWFFTVHCYCNNACAHIYTNTQVLKLPCSACYLEQKMRLSQVCQLTWAEIKNENKFSHLLKKNTILTQFLHNFNIICFFWDNLHKFHALCMYFGAFVFISKSDSKLEI